MNLNFYLLLHHWYCDLLNSWDESIDCSFMNHCHYHYRSHPESSYLLLLQINSVCVLEYSLKSLINLKFIWSYLQFQILIRFQKQLFVHCVWPLCLWYLIELAISSNRRLKFRVKQIHPYSFISFHHYLILLSFYLSIFSIILINLIL